MNMGPQRSNMLNVHGLIVCLMVWMFFEHSGLFENMLDGLEFNLGLIIGVVVQISRP